MTGFAKFDSFDAVGLADLVSRGEVKAEDLLEAAVERYQSVNDKVNAVVTPLFDEARKAISDGLPDGPLKGVPFLLKDLYADMAGTPLANGCGLFADNVSAADTEIVQRYKNAGLVIMGKTNTPEFGLTVTTEPRHGGATRNPWNTEHSAGGSSGGAAAAVAARIVPAAHASDGGGSIRIPASCCGLFGLKPTRGRISVGPFNGEGWAGMSMQHAVTISVRDSAALLDAVAGPATGDPYYAAPPSRPYFEEVGTEPGKLRLAVSTQSPNGTEVDGECVEGVQNAVQLCKSLGHSVEEVAPNYDHEKLRDAAATIIQSNTAAAVNARARDLGRELQKGDVENITWLMTQSGNGVSAESYINAVKTIHAESRKIAAFFETYDAFIMPTLGQPPAPIGLFHMDTEDIGDYVRNLMTYSPFCQMANATGQPAMSMPLHWSQKGLPVGVQFVGRYADEATLFRLASQIELESPWASRRPNL